MTGNTPIRILADATASRIIGQHLTRRGFISAAVAAGAAAELVSLDVLLLVHPAMSALAAITTPNVVTSFMLRALMGFLFLMIPVTPGGWRVGARCNRWWVLGPRGSGGWGSHPGGGHVTALLRSAIRCCSRTATTMITPLAMA